MTWSEENLATFRDRYLALWGGDLRPLFLTPQAPWIIENVAVLSEARGQGLGKALLRALLEEGRSQQHDVARIMVINGNDVARHTYESIGFKPYQTLDHLTGGAAMPLSDLIRILDCVLSLSRATCIKEIDVPAMLGNGA